MATNTDYLALSHKIPFLVNPTGPNYDELLNKDLNQPYNFYLGSIIEFLLDYFAKKSGVFIAQKYTNNEVIAKYRYIPMAFKGNKHYLSKRKIVHKAWHNKANELISIIPTSQKTNALFVTVHHGRNADFQTSHETWSGVNKSVRKFTRLVKRMGKKLIKIFNFKVLEYIYSLESTYKGGCHCHMLLILDRHIKYSIGKDVHGKDKVFIHDTQIFNFLKDKLKHNFRNGFVDIAPVHDKENVQRYIVKELDKQNSAIELILKKVRDALQANSTFELTDKEVKSLLTIYHQIKYKLRGVVASRGITKGLSQKDIFEKDTIQDKNNCQKTVDIEESNYDKFYWITIGTVTRSQVYSHYINHYGKKPAKYWNIGEIVFDKKDVAEPQQKNYTLYEKIVINQDDNLLPI